MANLHLKIFKEKLNKTIDNQGYAGSVEVMRKIKESDYSYEKSTFVELQNQGISLATQSSPHNFLTALRIFIETLSPAENACEFELYQYFLKYPDRIDSKVAKYIKANTSKINTFYVFGYSQPILSIRSDSVKKKHIWFTEHLLPHCIESTKVHHKFMEYINTKMFYNEYWILEHIAKNLGLYEYEDINYQDTNIIEKAILDISKKIREEICEKSSIIFPISINVTIPNIDSITRFLTNHLPKIEENIIDVESKSSFLILLLFENDEHLKDIVSFQGRAEEIEMLPIQSELCEEWINDINGYFINNEETDIYKNFLNEYNKGCFIPECQTREMFFEKITKHILPNYSFAHFIKKNYHFRYDKTK